MKGLARFLCIAAIAVGAVLGSTTTALAYTAEPEGARLDTSSWNADPHVVIAWPTTATDLVVDAVSDENGAGSTWTIDIYTGTPPSGPSIQSPCSVSGSGPYQIVCTVSAAELAEGIEIWTGNGGDSITVGDATAAQDIAPAALFARGSDGDSQLLSGGRGADLLSTSEENTGPPSSAWLAGGIGHDTFVGAANSADIVSYSDYQRNSGVAANLDCIANDGNAVLDNGSEDVGCASTSIEGLEGTIYGDVLIGDGGSNTLYGLDGNDYLKGYGSSDQLIGGTGNDILTGHTGADVYFGDDSIDRPGDGAANDGDDTVNANEGESDSHFDCGGAGGDVANLDDATIDTAPVSGCETINRPAPASPPPPANNGPNPSGVIDKVPVADTTKTYVLDDLRGYTLDEIALLFWLGGVNADFRGSKALRALRKNLPKHPRGEKWREGDVIGHFTKIGTPLQHSAGQPAKISLGYWIGPKKESCLEEAKNYKGTNVDEFKNTMTDLGCKIDDVLPAFVNKLKGDDKCEVGKVAEGNKRNAVDAVVNIPRDPAKHDLFIGIGVVKPIKKQGLNYKTDTIGMLAPGWTLPKSNKTAFSGAVIARTGNWVGNVTVYVDTSGVKAESTTDSFHMKTSVNSETPGQFTTPVFKAGKEGTIDVLALGFDKNGNAVCGATQVKVKDFRRKSGQLLTTTSGRVYEYTPGASKPFTVRNDLAGKTSAARRLERGFAAPARSYPDARISANWWDGVVDWWNALWSGKSTAQAPPSQTTAAESGRGFVQFAPGRALSGNATPATVTVAPMVAAGGLNLTGAGGSGHMVAAGAGNVIFASTGMVAAGAGNMVAAGAGNMVAAGGGNIGGPVVDVTQSSIRDVAGVKLIGMDGGSMVAAGAGNMVAAGAGNMVAAGGGNLVNGP